jgi:hypothetical protein
MGSASGIYSSPNDTLVVMELVIDRSLLFDLLETTKEIGTTSN